MSVTRVHVLYYTLTQSFYDPSNLLSGISDVNHLLRPGSHERTKTIVPKIQVPIVIVILIPQTHVQNRLTGVNDVTATAPTNRFVLLHVGLRKRFGPDHSYGFSPSAILFSVSERFSFFI
jgi:hypothetical protein